MAPKSSTSSPKKKNSPLTQSTIKFKTTKPRPSPKAKAATRQSKDKEKRHDQGTSASEGRDDGTAHNSESDDDAILVNVKELDMQDKAGIYANYYREVRQKMGWIPPIHNEGQTKIHNMLRVFDNSYEYGPCVGLTRMQRWERAKAMGLNPPTEVRDILLTKQGREDPSLVHTVFHGLV